MNFNPLPLILSVVGIYFLVKLRFFFILHPVRTIGKTVRAVKDGRALKSLTLALAGTLGVGNVFGVAIGIIIGGPGSVFWLFISMFFAMIIKYAEVVISADNLFHDTDTHGGMFFVIRNSFKKYGRTLSLVYSASVLGLALVMGAALQSGTASDSMSEAIGIPQELTALILGALTLASILGGAKKIEKITVIIIPLTTIIYIIATFSIIVLNFSSLPRIASAVLSSAFSVDSAVGGILGFLLGAPFHEGFARGILSNEAGTGTSSIAHARNGVLNPSSAGLLGMFEVWFDTGFVCMITAFSILLSVPDISPFTTGTELIMYTVGNAFGIFGKYAIALAVFFFAFATVICWYYYGSESWRGIFGKKSTVLFLPIFVIAVILGALTDTFSLIHITDVLMAVITALTLLALIKNSDRIKALSERGGVIDGDLSRFRRPRIKGNVFSRERED